MAEDAQKPSQQERYIYTDTFTNVGTSRTAESHAAFFLPYLQSGISLLDCGCGPGTITAGLAQTVAPGEVNGLDIEESQLELARANAKKLGLSNVHFETGSVYDLPYSDSQFDAVFCHNVLQHLSDPLKVLAEMRRVLKPGGIVGVRDSDFTGSFYAPEDSVIDNALEIFFKSRQQNGGDPFIGKHLRALLREAGFMQTIGSASYSTWGTADATRDFFNVILEMLAGQDIARQAIEMGWADQSQMEQSAIALKKWAEHPDAFFALTNCEVIAWKE